MSGNMGLLDVVLRGRLDHNGTARSSSDYKSSMRKSWRVTMANPRPAMYAVAVSMVLALSACTNPYDPVQRTIGGGLIGAGSGAAIGAAAGGGHGAALGAAVGLITTPPPPRYR